MRVAGAREVVALEPAAALALWADSDRWASFVEGFGHALSVDREWPDEGAKLVWESTPGGRGRVTERVIRREELRLVTEVFEEALVGTQTFSATAAPDGDALVELTLEYELSRTGPLRELADWLFIRRALRDALGRTLRRFAVEAEEEAGLR